MKRRRKGGKEKEAEDSSQVLAAFDLFGLRRAKEVSTSHFIPL